MLNDCLVTLSFHVIVMGLCVTLVKVCCITDMRVLHWLINSLFPNVWINHFPNTTYETSEPFLQHCLGLRGLYNMLSLPKSAILSPFLSEVLGYYDPITNTFDIRGHVLGITLEDVLFLARIRIDGKPVLVKDYRNNHCSAIFEEVIYDVNKLYEIIEDTSADWKKRKAALLMVIVQCIIILSPNGINFYPPLFEVLSDPDGTFGTYAWGAAMLAFLQHHLEKLNQSTKLGGCTWLLVIPKLWDSLGLTSVREEMEAGQLDQHPFPMQWILEKLLLNSALGNDRRSDYRKKMHTVFENLEDEEICWTPYANWVLPDELKEDKWFVTRLGPIFCNNFVVHHKPHLVTKQFGGYELDPVMHRDKLAIFDHHIRFVDNRGSNGHDYFESYKRELILWDKKMCVDEVHDDNRSPSPSRSPAPSPPPPRRQRQRRDYSQVGGSSEKLS
ncbi:protein MAINTENANCE OF MERISTEMS-like isoform X2 [Chenopodium quinoa]|uniref:protein MAINTENANCE OF MERISTEMS-like isoform X2 n=1 Tax=Chenopodium quinoa TaxID=63459 RepID=UPI000B776FDC|nr:protein MAINTENANCE OF MERISTEMS-like isoform X2 [Chenopodium quinoa]